MKPFWRSIFFKSAFGSTALSQSSSWWVSSPSAELHATDPTFYGNQKQPLSCFFFTPSFHVISAHVFSVLFLLEEFWKNNITASKLVEKTFSNLGHYNGIIYNLPPIKGTRNSNNHQLAMSLTARQQLAKISGYAELQAEASSCQQSWHIKHKQKKGQETKNNIYIYTHAKNQRFRLVVCVGVLLSFRLVGCKVEVILWLATDFSAKMTAMESTNEKWPSELVVSTLLFF